MRSAIRGVVVAAVLVVVFGFSGNAEANWKWKDAGCVWDQNGDGPDECDPNLPVGEPPQVTEGTQLQT
jgi:hypothetical protein